MSHFETTFVVQPSGEKGDDRVGIFEDGERTVIVVADGSGGSGGGDVAAEAVICEVGSRFREITTAEGWVQALRQIDSLISSGETTAVVVDLRPHGICGASVGDSRAVQIDGGELCEWTARQQRKPLLGSQVSMPVGFSFPFLPGILLVGTDGFWNYVKRNELPRLIATNDFFTLPRLCVDMVRLKSGALWDDVAVVAVRRKIPQRTRNRYEI